MGVKFIIKSPWQHFIAVISPRNIKFALRDPGDKKPWFQLEGAMHGEDDPLWQCIRELIARRPQGEIELKGEEAKALADIVFEAVWTVGWRVLAGEDAFALTCPEMRGRTNVARAGRLIPPLSPSDRERLLVALTILKGLHPSWFAPAVPGLRERLYPLVRPVQAEDMEGQVWLDFREDNDLWERFRAKREWEEPSPCQTWLQGAQKIAQRLMRRIRWREKKERRRHPLISLDAPIETEEDEVLRYEIIPDSASQDPAAIVEAKLDWEARLNQLNERQRVVFNLRQMGFSQAEIAEKLQLSKGRVSQIMKEIRNLLR